MHYYICQDTLYRSQPFSSEEEMIKNAEQQLSQYMETKIREKLEKTLGGV